MTRRQREDASSASASGPAPAPAPSPACFMGAGARARAVGAQLRTVRALLDVVSPFPARKGMRRNVMRPGQDRVQGFTLGETKKMDVKDRLVPCQYNESMPELRLACDRLIRLAAPGFEYTTIQVNKDQQTALHHDAFNQGPSVIVGLGDYSGGEVVVHYAGGETRTYDIHDRFLRFDGRVAHETAPIRGGPRYTLVYFRLSPSVCKRVTPEAPRSRTAPACNLFSQGHERADPGAEPRGRTARRP